MGKDGRDVGPHPGHLYFILTILIQKPSEPGWPGLTDFQDNLVGTPPHPELDMRIMGDGGVGGR